MTALDVLLLIIAATALFLGWRAGFIAQIGKFAAVVAAIICCRLFGRRVAVWLVNANCSPGDSFDGATLWTIVAYAAIFISVYLLVSFLGSGLRRIVHAVLTPLVDRLAGALFKLLVYMLFVSLVLNLWLVLFPDSKLRSDAVASWPEPLTGLNIITFAPAVIGSQATVSIMDSLNGIISTCENKGCDEDVETTDHNDFKDESE